MNRSQLHFAGNLLRWQGSFACARRFLTANGWQAQNNPIVIVGGGPCGLLMSNLLSIYKVPSVLLEAQSVDERFRHPQAHFLNTRTMEILRYALPAASPTSRTVYERIQTAMPPVHQWKNFRFGPSMSDEPLAIVEHPVDRPIEARMDANGTLQENVNTNHARASESSLNPLSTCAVGHLAQHTFSRILYDSALEHAENMGGRSKLLFDTKVLRVNQETPHCHVETSSGDIFSASLVVACDGAHSMLRQSCGIAWQGQSGLQHLMNVHVKLSPKATARLHSSGNYAMLYSVFTPEVVAMVVCHSPGEYIIQIPYFPPFQTPQEDFGPNRIASILGGIFGPVVGQDEWEVYSVQPWTMSSLLADRYWSGRVALVGDAAHVFPPAGGFGMNTGLQDVFNLAWKVARAHHNDQLSNVESMLQGYHSERRHVAQQCAALSVRNYQRLLQVTKACYLDDQHPKLLHAGLNYSPLPLLAKQSIFRSLLRAALAPLAWLAQPNSVYAVHIRDKIRKVLRTGAGLPLLFPRFELGFSTLPESSSANGLDLGADTMAPTPELVVGKLVPHTWVRVVGNYPALQQYVERGMISTSNLPSQLTRDGEPTFVLLVVGDVNGESKVTDLGHAVEKKLGMRVSCVSLTDDVAVPEMTNEDLVYLVFTKDKCPARQAWKKDSSSPFFVWIRPDGHVAAIKPLSSDQRSLCPALLQSAL